MGNYAFKHKNTISGMDIHSYLELLNELNIYLKEYFLEYKGIKCSSFELIGISEFEIFYKILINFIDYESEQQKTPININGNITMTHEEFKIFYRIIKIKKIKNEKYNKYNKRK